MNLSTINVKPGQEITLTGTGFSKADPGTVRCNSLDGPIVGTFAPPVDRAVTGTVTVPADAKAGNYVLVVTQASADGKLSQMPVRALVTVTPPGGGQPVLGAAIATGQTPRADRLTTTDNSVSGATLVLVTLGVAGVGMFLAGVAALYAGRRGTVPSAEPVLR